jgi:hypothetical protein
MLKVLSAAALGTGLALAPAMAERNGADLLPPLQSPRIHFGTGATSGSRIAVYPEIPNIPGEDSDWTLVQWRKANPLKPSEFAAKSGQAPSFDWKAPDGNSELTISKRDNLYVFDLIGGNGASDATGESDIGLSADIVPHSVSAAHALVFSMNARLSAAEVTYETPQAKESGAVLAQAGISFRTTFRDPETHRAYSVQIGIPLVNSRNPRPEHVGCHFFGQNRAPQLNSEKVLAGTETLPFRRGAPVAHLTYHVNDYICDFISKPVPCRSSDGPQMTLTWPASAADLNNWSIASVVISLGTQNSASKQSYTGPQGNIKVGLEISDPRLTESSELSNGGRCPMHE